MSDFPASSLMGTYAPAQVRFVRGRGTELFDSEGRRYLDFLAGIAVVGVGHANQAVASAIARQAGRLVHVSNLFRNELAEPLAVELDRLVGDGTPLSGQVFFANSGAEANECAMKLARRFHGRGRHGVVSAYGSFHGRTLATLAATGQPHKHEPFAPMPEGFRHVAYGDLEALAAAADPCVVGAVMLEVVQGEAGVVEPPPGYLAEVQHLCRERSILLIVDEVQTGLGRTGRWFGFQHDDLSPDIVTIAKALGNGMPIGACWARAEVAAAFEPGDHGSTFGGQPLACAAGLATLAALVEMDAPSAALEKGRRLAGRLAGLDSVVKVRGRGLLLGVVVQPDLDARELATAALSAGLVVNAPNRDVIRLAPPLSVSDAEIDEAVEILAQVLGRAAAQSAGDSAEQALTARGSDRAT